MQQPQQQTAGDPRQMAFLLIVLRDVISYSSGDALALAIMHAQNVLKMTDKDTKKMAKMLMSKAASAWPEGFM